MPTHILFQRNINPYSDCRTKYTRTAGTRITRLRRVHRTLASLAILIDILQSMHVHKYSTKNPTADTASPGRRPGYFSIS